MSMKSKTKGKVGEREVAQFLRDHGVEARRGVQYTGGEGSPDVVADMPGVHLEVKRTEGLRLWAAMEQAHEDAGEGELPVVVHRSNKRPWVAILPFDDFIRLWQKAEGRASNG